MVYRKGEENFTPREAVSWNVAMKNAELISDLISRTTMAELAGNTDTQFFCLRSLRNNVNYGLNDTEIKKLDVLEQAFYKAKKIIAMLSKVEEQNNHEKVKLNYVKNSLHKILRVYYRQVMDMLFAMGYFPRKEDRGNVGF